MADDLRDAVLAVANELGEVVLRLSAAFEGLRDVSARLDNLIDLLPPERTPDVRT